MEMSIQVIAMATASLIIWRIIILIQMLMHSVITMITIVMGMERLMEMNVQSFQPARIPTVMVSLTSSILIQT